MIEKVIKNIIISFCPDWCAKIPAKHFVICRARGMCYVVCQFNFSWDIVLLWRRNAPKLQAKFGQSLTPILEKKPYHHLLLISAGKWLWAFFLPLLCFFADEWKIAFPLLNALSPWVPFNHSPPPWPVSFFSSPFSKGALFLVAH